MATICDSAIWPTWTLNAITGGGGAVVPDQALDLPHTGKQATDDDGGRSSPFPALVQVNNIIIILDLEIPNVC